MVDMFPVRVHNCSLSVTFPPVRRVFLFEMKTANFAGRDEAISFALQSSRGTLPVRFVAPIGELLRPFALSNDAFEQHRTHLGGIQESSGRFRCPDRDVVPRIVRHANVAPTNDGAPSSDETTLCYRFSGRRPPKDVLLLIRVELSKTEDEGIIRVSCEDAILSSTYLSALRQAIEQ